MDDQQRKSDYKKGSLTLYGTVAMGTGVMIDAGIFALTWQVAEYAGLWFPAAFLIAHILTAPYDYCRVYQSTRVSVLAREMHLRSAEMSAQNYYRVRR